MKKILFGVVLVFSLVGRVNAQQGETAKAFLERLSGEYASMKDFQAYLTIRRAGRTEAGILRYKAPDNLKIDFSTPQDQVLVINSEMLYLYVPRYKMVMEQKLKAGDMQGAGGVISSNGLKILIDNYNVSYVGGPQLQPIQSGSSQLVYKLHLEWRNFAEGFRSLEIAVNREMQIVRVIGITSLFETIQFDYSSIRTNQNIPSSEFVLQLDSTIKVNRYPDFLKPMD